MSNCNEKSDFEKALEALGPASVRQITVSQDSQTVIMRTGTDLRDAKIALGDPNCTQRTQAMVGLFRCRGKAQQYKCP